jgi:hypothetical protein
MNYQTLLAFIRLDPAEMGRLVCGRFCLSRRGQPLFFVFLWVVFLAPVVQMRVFLLIQALYNTEIVYNKGTAPTEPVSGWSGLCE